MTLHILPSESTTVQNFKFWPSVVIELREFNQKKKKKMNNVENYIVHLHQPCN